MNIFEFVWYRVILKIGDIPRKIKWFFQRVFRGYADPYIWSFYSNVIEEIYPKFKAFHDMSKQGLASCYFDEPEKVNHTDEDFEKAFKNYNGILDKILFAFEFILYDDCSNSRKFRKYFEEKHGNPYEETEGNKQSPTKRIIIDKDGNEKEENMFDGKPIYINMEMLMDFHKRAEEGIKLFGEYFFTFWD